MSGGLYDQINFTAPIIDRVTPVMYPYRIQEDLRQDPVIKHKDLARVQKWYEERRKKGRFSSLA